jgi:UDP-N-acetylmuramoyl-tripeptide--D-alanyl-D-alanine ligase
VKLSLNEIALSVNGKLTAATPEELITSVTADSREVTKHCLFIDLCGDNSEGIKHITEALRNGASCALASRQRMAGETRFPLIMVDDTRLALLQLAAYYRSKLNVKITAVTGSVGKTTTKDMIASVLSQKYRTLKTPGNRNNHIGLPLTLLAVDETHEAAVLEMGMNHAGEIRGLSLTAKPDVCVITNIGDSHIEHLGSREAILAAKLEICDGMKPGGQLVLNGDDPLLAGLRDRHPGAVYCSLDDTSSDVYASGIVSLGLDGMSFNLHIGAESRTVRVPLPGMHIVSNALLAAAVGQCFGLSLAQIATGIEAFKPTGRRLEMYDAHGMRIIDDAYNANPASMRAAIDVLSGITEAARRVCVLGDMFELGERSPALHREIGEYIESTGIDLVIAVGQKAREYLRGGTYWFKDNDAFINKWKDILQPGDAVLFKASNGMRFNEIITAITGNGHV